MNLSDRIKACRRRIGLTQEEFGQKLGTTQKIVSRWEKGVKPRERMLERIAEAGNVTYEWLALGVGDVDDAASLSKEEKTLLEYYRSVGDKRYRYELLARFKNAPDFLRDITLLERRVASIFFNENDEVLKNISECLERRLRERYDELSELEAELLDLTEEHEEGVLGGDVIENLNGQVEKAKSKIAGLRRFDKHRAIIEINQLADNDMSISLLLDGLES